MVEFVTVVGGLLVHDLFEEFNRTLRVLVVCKGHVDVVDEVEDLAQAPLGPKLPVHDFLHLPHQEVVQRHRVDLLVEAGRCLARLFIFICYGVQELFNECSLACAY